MANTLGTVGIITKTELEILASSIPLTKSIENNTDEFNYNINGYKQGNSVSIRYPQSVNIRNTSTFAAQPVVDLFQTLAITSTFGADMNLTTQEMTLKISEKGPNGIDKWIKPAVAALAQQ